MKGLSVIARVFHNWERRLAAAAENRVVRPFEWGLEWIEGVDDADGDVAETPVGVGVAHGRKQRNVFCASAV